MIYRILLVALCVVAFTVNAEARQRHKTYLAHPDCNILWPCEGVSPSPRGEMIAKQVGFGVAQKVYKPRASRAQRTVSRVPTPRARPVVRAAAPSISYAIAKPARYIAGRLICAVNVNAALAERGIKGTGSALAKSFLSWGRSAGGPVPGAVIVSNRRGGGHVAIVSRVENGVIYAWNATGGQRGWREIPYRKAVIDYRVPG